MNGQFDAPGAYVIVVGNEKGGTGKSTTAMHLGVALAARGFDVRGIDLDHRQRSFARFAENRHSFAKETGAKIPLFDVTTIEPSGLGNRSEARDEERATLDSTVRSMSGAEFIVIDTPGSDSSLSRLGHEQADTLITPMNESFVDVDILARIDRENREVLAPSVYCQMVWEQHNRRVSDGKPAIDWVVLCNRVSHIDSYGRRDVRALLAVLAKRLGFRLATGFGDRMVFRELFPKGLTLLDLPDIAPETRQNPSHEAGRREVGALLRAIGLPEHVLAMA